MKVPLSLRGQQPVTPSGRMARTTASPSYSFRPDPAQRFQVKTGALANTLKVWTWRRRVVPMNTNINFTNARPIALAARLGGPIR
jgi:hypothetical protein